MGWGNQADSRHERWFIEQFVDAGYEVHAIELPTNGTDLERDYLGPVRDYRADLPSHTVICHSMGGLVTAHLRPDTPVVYLSPFWGLEFPSVLTPLLWLPVSRPFLPSGVAPGPLGELATAEDATAPKSVSPKWLRTMTKAQATLPDLKESDVVFYSPTDVVVDTTAIVEHADSEQLHQYDGGHELFSSAGRDEYVDRVLAALER